MRTTLNDCARFLPGDPGELVASSFMCPHCLRIDVSAVVSPDGLHAEAGCACRNCGTRWSIALDGMQHTRLALAPPDPAGYGWNLDLRHRVRRPE